MILHPLHRAIAAAAVLAAALVMTACGGDDEPTEDPAPAATDTAPSDQPTDQPTEEPIAGTVLSEDEMAPALLTPADLPGEFVVDPDPGDDESGGFEGSCLEEVGQLTDQPEFDADEKVEASYVLTGDAGQSSVKSQVQSYADQEQVATAIGLFSEVVGGCTEASGTDADGVGYDLEILSDQTVSLSGVDEQARVAVKGTITTQGQTLPVDIGYNVARAANNLVIISTIDVGDVGDGIVSQTDVVAQLSVDRLAAIIG